MVINKQLIPRVYRHPINPINTILIQYNEKEMKPLLTPKENHSIFHKCTEAIEKKTSTFHSYSTKPSEMENHFAIPHKCH